jgi:copper chaperone CopZ
MKNQKLISYLTLVLFLGLLLVSCNKNNKETISKDDEKVDVTAIEGKYVEINLPTMQCSMCKATIEKAVNKVEGVNHVNVVVNDKIAKVKYDKSKTELSKIEDAITAAGYQANDKPEDKEAYDNLAVCCKKPEDQKY